jgi:dsDNA-specific endonuclease/ATPase MutS2
MQPGQLVSTPLGAGVVREVRNGGRVLVDIRGRAVMLHEADLAVIRDSPRNRKGRRQSDPPRESRAADRTHSSVSVDLHGLTVVEALARVEQALNDAALGDVSEVRLIHGRSGGRIRGALHRRLGEIPSIRAYSLDPANAGVTIVLL